MSRESDDNLSSINSAYTDLYQETVKRFTRSSLSPEMDRYSPTRLSFKSTSPSQRSDTTRRTSYHGAVLTFDTEQFIIGQRVWVGGIRPGQIAYIGETHFAPGDWAGVVLDEPNGKNDGCVAGKRYFQCEPKRGIFSRLTRLTTAPLSGAHTPTSPLLKNSPERSRTVSPTSSLLSTNLRSPGKNGLTVGDRVIVSSGFGSRPGILRYLGETQFASGNWCGIELDEATGKNDGSVDGIRYFECKPKYGVFVPIAKVSLSPSSKKCRLHRSGSRESLTSIGTMNSIATTNTSRMRMSAQRKSLTQVRPVTTPKTQFSMQDLLRERQNHIEQLLIERDMDREDAQNQALNYQKNINELKSRLAQLEHELLEERKKNEDLQNLVDEATFCGDELNAQTQDYKDKIQDLENKLTELASGNPSLQSFSLQDSTATAQVTEALNKQLEELRAQLKEQEQRYRTELAEIREEETNLLENIKYLKGENESLQQELREKDENLEKFSLSESGIENLKRELHLLKTENEKEKQQLLKDFEQKLDEKNNEIKQLLDELLGIRNSLATLESDRSNVTDECEILRNECKSRDEQMQQLKEQIAELTSELSMVKAESSTLDELLSTKQQQWTDEKAALAEKAVELAKLKQQFEELQVAKASTDDQLAKSNEEQKDLLSARQTLEAQLADYKEVEAKLEQLSVENKKLQTTVMQLENLQLELKTNNQRTEHSLQEKSNEVEGLTVELTKLRQQNQLLEKDSSLSTQQMSHKVSELEAQNRKLQQSLNANEMALKTERVEHKQQAEQLAEKLKELKSNMEVLDSTNKLLEKLRHEHELARSKCEVLAEQVRQSEESYSQKQLELGDLTRKYEALCSKCSILESENTDLLKDVSAARNSGTELQSTVKKLNDELAIKQQTYAERENQSKNERLQLESSIDQLQQQNTKAEHEIAALKEKLLAAQSELGTKSVENTTLQEQSIKLELDVSDALRQNEILQAKCETLMSENASLQQDLLNLRTSSTDSNAEMVKLTQDLGAKQRAYEELSDKSSSERAALEGQLQASQQRIDALCNQVEALTNENSLSAEQQFKQLEQLKQTEEKCSQQELELSDLQRKLAAMSGKAEALNTNNQELQTELTALRGSATEAQTLQLKLTEELAAKQKALQQHTDQHSAERLQAESQLQELNQLLEGSRADAEQLKYELLKQKETNLLLAQEFETYKAERDQSRQNELAELQAEAQAKQQRLIESYELQLQNAEKSKSTLDEGISSLQNQIKLLQEELLKSQLDFRSKEENLTRQINALTMEKKQLRDNLKRMENEGSSTLTSVQQEKLALLGSIQQLADDVALRDKEIIALTAEAEQAKIAKANLSSDYATMEHKLQQLQDTLNTYEQEVKAKSQLAQQQDEKINELRALVEAAQLSNANMSTRNAELSETLQALEQEKCEIRNIFELFEMEADQNLSTKKQELANTQAELHAKSDLLSSAEVELSKLREELQGTQKLIQEKETNSSETSIKLQAQLQVAEQALSESEANRLEMQERFQEMDERLQEYKQVIDEMDDAGKEKTTTLSALELQLTNERARAQQIEATLSAQCEELRGHIARMESQRANEVLQFNDQIKLLQLQSTKSHIPAGGGDEICKPEDNSAHINFLNSIIADMQKKNEELKTRLNTLEANPLDFTQPNAFDHIKKRKPAPRVFCDICDVFDSHETEDCPLQASEDYSPPLSRSASNNNNDPANKKERKLPEPRKYCVSCEVFGHEAGECDDECF